MPKLAIFDFDGTIAKHAKISKQIPEGFQHLQQQGCITTISTGRSYVRLKDLLGDQFEKLISPNALIMLEHGTKIVKRDGTLVFGEFFSDAEIEHIVDFLRSNISIFKFVAFSPVDVHQKVQIWCAEENTIREESDYRGRYAELFTCPIGELKTKLLDEKLTSISLKLQDHIQVENLKLTLTKTETNLMFQDGNMEFLKSNINKGLSVLYVLRELGIKRDDLLLAGNAINDVEMLDMDAAMSILVGPEDYRKSILEYMSEPERIIGIDSPEELGKLLQTL